MALSWKLITVLPNLTLAEAWEFGPFAFVPSCDQRLESVRANTRAARALLDNYKDAFGRKCDPTALIVRSDMSKARLRWNHIVDLRNALYPLRERLRCCD
jgi:hypothetical protein